MMIIYKATNTVNGKSYIGQTSQPFIKRRYQHINVKAKTYFKRALDKHGTDNFTWVILCECNSKEEMNEMEFHYIKQYHSHKDENGYNLTWGGDGMSKGQVFTEEHKANMSKNHADVSGSNHPRWGKKCSEETKRKIGEGQKGRSYDYSKKTYLITFPDGHTEVITGLLKFCREYSLTNSNMCVIATGNGRQKTHKGFACRYL